MAVAQGSCPACGAPLEFGVGSSMAKVCEYCRATVVRSDRGLQNLGKVADLANTPSLIAVGDSGTLGGRPFRVMGRVQLDHGKGPWDEYYVSFDYGQAWGWLAYAQGHWYATSLAPGISVPPHGHLRVEQDLPLGPAWFRVAEFKTGTVTSAEGELPEAHPPGFVRHYADLYGQQSAFATIDYGDHTTPPEVFIGYVFSEAQLEVTEEGPRTIHKVRTSHIKCASCGGDVPKLSGDRAERVGCPYCGAVTDIALQQTVAQQEKLLAEPLIPIGSKGAFDGVEYICIAQVKRGTDWEEDDESGHFTWEEYLLWSKGIGYRWLVKDEHAWLWVMPVNLAELDLTRAFEAATWGGREFALRNRSEASVEHVLGEIYWKCEVGETVHVTDYVNGADVLSREEMEGEVVWSYSSPIPWAVIAGAFGLAADAPGGQVQGASKPSSSAMVIGLIVVVVLLLLLCGACGACADDDGTGTSSGTGTSGVYGGGSGIFGGGK